jgi:hypothetical protein
MDRQPEPKIGANVQHDVETFVAGFAREHRLTRREAVDVITGRMSAIQSEPTLDHIEPPSVAPPTPTDTEMLDWIADRQIDISLLPRGWDLSTRRGELLVGGIPDLRSSIRAAMMKFS